MINQLLGVGKLLGLRLAKEQLQGQETVEQVRKRT